MIAQRCPVVDGELQVEATGDGPPLLMIAGGLGSAGSYRALAKRLGSDYTVLTYDRRGHFRSTDRTTGPISVSTQADDARAVIEHAGLGKATVFGTSAGALIGLDLAARHPDVLTGLIAHEPPLITLLPDAYEWLEFAEAQVNACEKGDLIGAFTQFVGSLAGAGLPELKMVRLPNEEEWSYLFTREIRQFYSYEADLVALRRSRVEITPTAGRDSRGYYHYRPAKALALELGQPFAEVPGAHLAPQRNPKAFEAALRELLADLT
ncbi:alpha/beta fold hydrolase [Amycolatopsis magusensis]|uniref:Pimeloyl-ACP methyl ester carboxylesterase n=1 Tax=Amycolatopsis magusensis TaxID=882444 RepID=A0ABS4Q469_9PSEU|nr:alpha/beta hydrolase [Amycolatopsis magusensis]MBP2185915.1 pimeloyl-ACP methyl ester carboxylesterase [Amycolatopsis magusensis]